MEKIAYLVLGTESSATRFATSCLVAAGCEGTDGHHQDIDFKDPIESKIVWRRSYPHKWDDPNNFPYIIKNTIGWPDTDAMYNRLTDLGYKVVVVVTTRDWNCINNSAKVIAKRPHSNTPDKATLNSKISYKKIFEFIIKYDLDYILFNYEAAILAGDKYINKMLEIINLPPVGGFNIQNQNAKYYDR